MKGVIYNLLEEVIRREHGDALWESMLEETGLDGAYTSLGSYPDEHLVGLVGVASARLGLPEDEVVRWFGRQAMPLLADSYPQFFAGHSSVLTLLPTLNHTIHSEVRKIYRGADVPDFTFETPGPDRILLGYRSKRRLCALAHGFIEASATIFGERLEITQPLCMHRGDEHCEFDIRRLGPEPGR